MPGRRRDEEERIPEFYLSPTVQGQPTDPQVEAALKQIWPWLWGYVGWQLGRHDQASEVADQVARRISRHLQAHPGSIRSLVAICRVAAINVVATARSKESRLLYRGLGEDLDSEQSALEPEWQARVELAILSDQIASQLEGDVRTMFNLRVLGHTWAQVGKQLGLTAGQARLRFGRAMEPFLSDRQTKPPGGHEEPK